MAINMSVVFYVLISVCHLASVSASASNTFQAISCPGDVLTTECINTGGVATVWRGTAFQCGNGVIILQHSQFGSPHNINVTCNNVAIIAQGLEVINDSYISQLSVTVSPELNNTTVECWQYNKILIRSIQIIVLATGK